MIALSHIRKPSRKEAFDLACKAKTHHLSESEIDSLINYFAPTVPATPKTAFQWVARAVAVNDIRKYLQFVHVSGGVMRATDGRRLHWAPTDLADGYYDAKTGLPAKCDTRYPEVLRVIPKIERMSEFKGSPVAGNRYIYKKEVFILTYEGMQFNKKYVDEAIAGTVYLDHEKMRGSNDFGEFVIMFMKG